MRKIMLKMWADDKGALLSAEWVFMATILVIGVSVGLVCVRNGVVAELSEFGNAMTHLNQSYEFSSIGNTEPLHSSFASSASGSHATNTTGNIGVDNIRLYAPQAAATDIDEHLTN